MESVRRACGRYALLHGLLRDISAGTLEGNEEERSRSCGYLGEAHFRLRKSQCRGSEGSRLLTQSRRLVLLDHVSDGQVGGWENVMESPDHKGTCRLWRRYEIYSE